MKHITAYLALLLIVTASLMLIFGTLKGLAALLACATPGAVIYLCGVRDFKSWRWMDEK